MKTPSTTASQMRAFLVFQDRALLSQVQSVCVEAGFQAAAVEPAWSVHQEDVDHALVVYETGDDAALLAMLVHELYHSSDPAVSLSVVGIVSERSLSQNPSLGRWLINGRAALASLLPNDQRLFPALRQCVLRARRSFIAADTMRITAAGEYVSHDGVTVDISNSLTAAVSGSRVYYPCDFPQYHDATGGRVAGKSSIHVHAEDVITSVLRAAQARPDEEVACLNFTAATHRGAPFVGTSYSQEMSLLSSSGLYACLRRLTNMYETIRAAGTSLYSDTMAYSGGVPVFRDASGVLLSSAHRVGFVSAVPVCARGLRVREPDKLGLIRTTMQRRVARLIWLVAEHGHRSLVLGAWGCGGGGNDPEMIADVFAHELVETGKWGDHFRDVFFAIQERADGKPVLEAFRRRFASSG